MSVAQLDECSAFGSRGSITQFMDENAGLTADACSEIEKAFDEFDWNGTCGQPRDTCPTHKISYLKVSQGVALSVGVATALAICLMFLKRSKQS